MANNKGLKLLSLHSESSESSSENEEEDERYLDGTGTRKYRRMGLCKFWNSLTKCLAISFMANTLTGIGCLILLYGRLVPKEGVANSSREEYEKCRWADRCCYLTPMNVSWCNIEKKSLLESGNEETQNGLCSWTSGFGPYFRDLMKDAYNIKNKKAHTLKKGEFGWLVGQIFSNYGQDLYLAYNNRQNIARDLWIEKLKGMKMFPKKGIQFKDYTVPAKQALHLSRDEMQSVDTIELLSSFFQIIDEELMDYAGYHGGQEIWLLLDSLSSENKQGRGHIQLPASLDKFPKFEIPSGLEYDYLYLTYFENRYPKSSIHCFIPPPNCKSALRGDSRINLNSECVKDRSADFINIGAYELETLPKNNVVIYDAVQFLKVFSAADWRVPSSLVKDQALLALSEFCNNYILDLIVVRLRSITQIISKAFAGIHMKRIEAALNELSPSALLYQKIAMNIMHTDAFVQIPMYKVFIKGALAMCRQAGNFGDLSSSFWLANLIEQRISPKAECSSCNKLMNPVILPRKNSLLLECQLKANDCTCLFFALNESMQSLDKLKHFSPTNNIPNFNAARWKILTHNNSVMTIADVKNKQGPYWCKIRKLSTPQGPKINGTNGGTKKSKVAAKGREASSSDCSKSCASPEIVSESGSWKILCSQRDTSSRQEAFCDACLIAKGSLKDLLEMVANKTFMLNSTITTITSLEMAQGRFWIRDSNEDVHKCHFERICEKCRTTSPKVNSWMCYEILFSTGQCPCRISYSISSGAINILMQQKWKRLQTFLELLFQDMENGDELENDLINPYKADSYSPFQMNVSLSQQSFQMTHLITNRRFQCDKVKEE